VPESESPAPPVDVDSLAPAAASVTVVADPSVLATLELVAEDYASASRSTRT
jgi:hypothetical protein